MGEFLDWVRKGPVEVASFIPASGIGNFKAVVTRIPRLSDTSKVFILLDGKILGGETFSSSKEAKEWAETQLLGF